MDSKHRFPMKFYKYGLIIFIYQTESMHTKTLHHAQASRKSAVAHGPHDRVHAFRSQGNKIPKCIMSGGCLGHLVVRLRFYRMNKIWKFYSVLNKENRHIVPNQVVVAFFCIKFNCETPYIACHIGRSAGTCHCAKPCKNRSSGTYSLQEFSFGIFRHGFSQFKIAVGSTSSCMNNALRNSFMINRKSTRLNSSHANISYAVFCLKKK